MTITLDLGQLVWGSAQLGEAVAKANLDLIIDISSDMGGLTH